MRDKDFNRENRLSPADAATLRALLEEMMADAPPVKDGSPVFAFDPWCLPASSTMGATPSVPDLARYRGSAFVIDPKS
ncbi:MAG: hypothetical protein M3Y72_18800 [Acidobacteriota bacterium]|nr:hypothetical protein [Acidobacteriota bacterium]